MESDSEMVPFPLLMTPIESNYRACTIPYRFRSDNPHKATPTEIAWIDLFLNSIPSFKKRAESDPTVPDAPSKAEKFAQRYFYSVGILLLYKWLCFDFRREFPLWEYVASGTAKWTCYDHTTIC
ncbi:hypothetical protein SLE2022_142140 [Rubroshorea leprosula]